MRDEIEEVCGMGKYTEGNGRPLKIKFSTQVTAKKIVSGSWNLFEIDYCKGVYTRRDMNDKERSKHVRLFSEAME